MRPESGGPADTAPRLTGAHAIAVLTIAVLAAFLPVRENGFVSYDDRQNFLENPSFRGLGRSRLAWAWTTPHLGVYEPLGWMLLGAEYDAWGLDPRGYHLASLALYGLAMIGLYGVAVALLARSRPGLWRDDPGTIRGCACLAVALFAVHPLRVQVVAWASCQSYVLCGLFSTLTVLAYLRAHEHPPRVRRGRLAVSLVLYAASLLSKAPAITLPAVLLVLDAYPLGRIGRGRWLGPEARRVYREKVPFVILALIFAALAVWARGRATTPVAGHDLGARAARACYNVMFYLGKTVAPVRISASYPLPLRMTPAEPQFLLSAAAVAAVTAALVVARRRAPGALSAWVVYLVMLAPSSGLFRTGGKYIAADRYGFLPLMGLAVLVASGLCAAMVGRARRARALVALAAGAGVGVVLIATSRELCRTWRDSASLWGHALAASTEPNPPASLGLAMALADDPDGLARAESLLDAAMREVPQDPALHNAMTTVLARRGRTAEAMAHARAALRLEPDNLRARVNLGNLLALRGDPDGARAAYAAALRLNPDDVDAHANLGMLLAAEGHAAEAEAQLVEALRINPGSTRARQTLDDLRRRRGRAAAPGR